MGTVHTSEVGGSGSEMSEGGVRGVAQRVMGEGGVRGVRGVVQIPSHLHHAETLEKTRLATARHELCNESKT